MKNKILLVVLLLASATLAQGLLKSSASGNVAQPLKSTLVGTSTAQPLSDDLRRELDDSDADDAGGRVFKWEAGGKDGFTFDVFIRAAPLGTEYHLIEKATITIDKDGRIIKIEGKPGRTRIKG